MAIVVGVDFGTLSVRATVLDTRAGVVSTASRGYPLKRSQTNPDLATQSHGDHMTALVEVVRSAIEQAGVDGGQVAAIACDTTGSSVVMLDRNLAPLEDYYLWCDHRAHAEAEEITEAARREGLEALTWCGGVYSHEWGYAKVLHFLRHNAGKRATFATAAEHCDMVAATLCGVGDLRSMPRSVCAMGHKWMWGLAWGGLPPQDFLTRIDPLLGGVNEALSGRYGSSQTLAGWLAPAWAERMGLRHGIPVPIGAFDAHWDAVGAGCRLGDIVNVVGTSTCIIALGAPNAPVIPGLCGMVPGSVHPDLMGVEAGLSATGDIYDAIARRASSDVQTLSQQIVGHRPGQSGLLRLAWDNGDRSVLVRSDLTGVTLGWDLNHTAADELHAAIEGTAFHTRIVLEAMQSGGIAMRRVINAGGIPQKNDVLNQVYADVIGCPILVPDGAPAGLGSCIFASLAAGAFSSIEEAQDALCLPMKIFQPSDSSISLYGALFDLYKKMYFGLGRGGLINFGDVLPKLRSIRRFSQTMVLNQPL